MKDYIGRHRADTRADFIELALGTPLELWLGVENESDEERAARIAAARDILAEDPGMPTRLTHLAADAFAWLPADVVKAVARPPRSARATLTRRAA